MFNVYVVYLEDGSTVFKIYMGSKVETRSTYVYKELYGERSKGKQCLFSSYTTGTNALPDINAQA